MSHEKVCDSKSLPRHLANLCVSSISCTVSSLVHPFYLLGCMVLDGTRTLRLKVMSKFNLYSFRVGHEAHYIVAKPWIIYGLVAGITFSIVFFMAWEPFRKRFYEYFVLSHNIFILYVALARQFIATEPLYEPYSLTIVFTYLHCVPVE